MMLPSDPIALTVDGARWQGWTDMRVVRSIEAVSGTFDLTLTVDGIGAETPRHRLSPGQPCTVEIGGEVVITGYIDDIAPQMNASSHGVSVRGRDASGDLVDCSAQWPPSGEFASVTVLALAEALARPFGVAVRADVDVGEPLARWRIQEGESVWECLERACRHRALLAVSDGQGGIVLTRADAATASGANLRPGDVLEAGATFSLRERYSEYILKGQRPLEDSYLVSQAAAETAQTPDPAVPRHRPLVVVAEDGADIADRAAWEATTRAGRGLRAEVTVAGWRSRQTGALWHPLTTVRVDLPWLGLAADLLVVAVEWSLDASRGSTTRLDLADPRAFQLQPLPAQEE